MKLLYNFLIFFPVWMKVLIQPSVYQVYNLALQKTKVTNHGVFNPFNFD
jgi:hypothetical protein